MDMFNDTYIETLKDTERDMFIAMMDKAEAAAKIKAANDELMEKLNGSSTDKTEYRH